MSFKKNALCGLAVAAVLCLAGTASAIECPGDTNFDGQVDVVDLLNVLQTWGFPTTHTDFDQDGIVTVLDLLILLSFWGPCP